MTQANSPGPAPSKGRGLPAAVVTVLLLVLELAVLFGASISLGASDASEPAPASGRVVLVGGHGSSWAGVDRVNTPTLFGTAALGGVGSLSPRTATATSCVPDAWLTISAGRRSTADCAPAAVTTSGDGSATVTGWERLVARQHDLGYDAKPGLLGDAVKAAGRTICAVGPQGAAGAADSTGKVPVYLETSPGRLPPDCAVTLIAAGDLEQGAADLNELLASDDATTDVYLAGLAARPAATGVGGPQLQVLAHYRHGEGIATTPSWLTSASTRWQGMAQITDVTPTLLSAAGISIPAEAVGSVVVDGQHRPAGGNAAHTAIDEMRETNDRAVSGVLAGWIAVGISVLGAFVVIGVEIRRLRLGHSHAVARGLAIAAAAAVALTPLATYLTTLVPLVDFLPVLPQLTVTTLVIAALGTAAVVIWLGRGHNQPAAASVVVLGLLIVGILGLDTLSGGHLQQATPFGNDPLLGGRFYGMRNLTFGLFAAAALMAAAGVARLVRADRTLAVRSVLLIGLGAVAIDGMPSAGADVGGMLSLLPGVLLLAMLVGGVRLRPARLLLVLASGVAVVVAAALADYLRPAGKRTHLGRFIADLISGDGGAVLARKVHDNLHAVGSPAVAVLVAVVLVAMGAVLAAPGLVAARLPRRAAVLLAPVTTRLAPTYAALPELRHGVWAVLLSSVIAMLVNDSGVTLGLAFALTLLPILLAAVALRPRVFRSAGDARPSAG
jgi:hypothetical protein